MPLKSKPGETKGEILSHFVILSPIFVFWSILFIEFFWTLISFEGKNSGARQNFLFMGIPPYKYRLSTPPPHTLGVHTGLNASFFSSSGKIMIRDPIRANIRISLYSKKATISITSVRYWQLRPKLSNSWAPSLCLQKTR